MGEKIKNIFKNIEQAAVPTGLREKILKKVILEREWQIKKRLILTDILFFSSIGMLFFAIVNFGGEFTDSAFWNLARLVFSDTKAIFFNWKDFLLSLLETFPAGHMAIILLPIFTLLASLQLYFKQKGFNNYKLT